MGCAMGIVKYLVFLFNLVFALAGAALIAVGVLVKLNVTDAISEGDNNIHLAPIFTIIVGAVIFVIAFFGCCGAIRESTCMLTTYAIILLIFFILQVAIGVYAFIEIKDERDLQNEVEIGLDKLFSKANQGDEAAKEFFDSIQTSLECCGLKGPTDYHVIPPSCCKDDHGSCTQNNAYNRGCTKEFTEKVQTSIKTVAIVVFVIAAVEIIGAIFALCLNSSIRNSYRRGTYA